MSVELNPRVYVVLSGGLVAFSLLYIVDSFFTKLCSTPSKSSDCSMSKYVQQQDGGGNDDSSPSALQDTPHKV